MRHIICPETMTIEALADWIRSNRVDTKNHVEKIVLTEDEKKDLAVKSSLASRAIVRLEGIQQYAAKLIKKGTPWDTNRGKDGDHIPVDISIPPTAGIDVLKSNRLYADQQIEKGYREEITPIYFLPWPEFEKMVALDIKGEEWGTYSRDMNSSEIKQHGKPVLKASQEIQDIMEDQGLEIEKVEGKTVKLRKKNSAVDKQPALSNDEKEELEKSDVSDVEYEDDKEEELPI